MRDSSIFGHAVLNLNENNVLYEKNMYFCRQL